MIYPRPGSMKLSEGENKSVIKPKAVALVSGGLDSGLAVKLVADMGVDVFAINFVSPFNDSAGGKSEQSAAVSICKSCAVELKRVIVGEDYLDVIKNPRHGYGSEMNPCIDCRIFFLKKARRYMEEIGADFLITGEVVGQRPMSQMKPTIRQIEKEANCHGLILRPLSGKILPETKAEKKGWVDMEKLLSLSGRSRKPQMKLAKELGITDYTSPAGGCLLTDKSFSKKLRDLLEHNPSFGFAEVEHLKYGRHFRFEGIKIIVGRNEKENITLEKFYNDNAESELMLEATDYVGPTTLVESTDNYDAIEIAARLTARYCDGKYQKEVRIHIKSGSEKPRLLTVPPLSDDIIEKLRI